ncbi:MAG: redoxin domain-containing protein, partial [Cyclobacteriaceae bacterium]
MKYLAISLFVLILSCNSSKRDGYTITGLTSDLPDSTLVFLTELEFTKEKPDFVPKIVDSTFIIDNKFIFQGNIDSKYQIMVLRLKDFSQYKYLWVENNQMTFDASNSTFRYAKISGSRIQDQASEHFNISDPFEIKLDSIEVIAETTGLMAETRTEKEDSLRSVLFEAYQQIEIAQREAETIFVRSNPDYELSSFILLFLQNYISEDIVKELYEGLSEDVKQNVFSSVVKDHIINSLKLEIGQKAPNITLPDVQGNELSLSDFSGKYVLIDFWSSTCGPCRLENKNLLKAYEEFGERGFE